MLYETSAFCKSSWLMTISSSIPQIHLKLKRRSPHRILYLTMRCSSLLLKNHQQKSVINLIELRPLTKILILRPFDSTSKYQSKENRKFILSIWSKKFLSKPVLEKFKGLGEDTSLKNLSPPTVLILHQNLSKIS